MKVTSKVFLVEVETADQDADLLGKVPAMIDEIFRGTVVKVTRVAELTIEQRYPD